MAAHDWIDIAEGVVAIAGLAAITLLTRSFFMLPEREWRQPAWLKRGLRYAPLAALTAVIGPEVLMRDGHLVTTLADARLPAAVVGLAFFVWKRSILGTIVVGMAVYLPLHIGLGW
jgi:branched-subunit amino acid transport protein